MMFSSSFLFGRHFTHPFVRNRNKICILRGSQEFYWRTIRTLKKNKHQNPDVQRVDNGIQRINHYPADNWWQNLLRYPPKSDLSSGERYLPFEQPGPGVKMFFNMTESFHRHCFLYETAYHTLVKGFVFLTRTEKISISSLHFLTSIFPMVVFCE